MNRQIILFASFVAAAALGVTAGATVATATDPLPTTDLLDLPTLPVDLPTLPVDLPTLPVDPPVPTDPDPTPVDPTPTVPDPTPTQPDPTPTQPDPTPTQPDPTPTQPDPTPTSPDPAPTETGATPVPVVPAPVAGGTTPPSGPLPDRAVATPAPGAAAPGTPVTTPVRFGPAPTPTPTPTPTPAPGVVAGVGPLAADLGGLWPLDPFGTSTTPFGAAASPLPVAAPVLPLGPSDHISQPVVDGTPAEQPAGLQPAAQASDDGGIPWTLLALGLGALLLLAAIAAGRDAATAAYHRALARRRRAVMLSLVEATHLPGHGPVSDPPTHGVVRLDQSDVRWKRGLFRARFVVIATSPSGAEAQIGASAWYWALTDRRSPRSVAVLSTLLASFRRSGWYEAPAIGLWYRSDRLSRDDAWYAWRLQRDQAPVRRSARPNLDRRDAEVAIREAG